MKSKAGFLTVAATAALLATTPRLVADDCWKAVTPETSEAGDIKIARGLAQFVEEEFPHVKTSHDWTDLSMAEYAPPQWSATLRFENTSDRLDCTFSVTELLEKRTLEWLSLDFNSKKSGCVQIYGEDITRDNLRKILARDASISDDESKACFERMEKDADYIVRAFKPGKIYKTWGLSDLDSLDEFRSHMALYRPNPEGQSSQSLHIIPVHNLSEYQVVGVDYVNQRQEDGTWLGRIREVRLTEHDAYRFSTRKETIIPAAELAPDNVRKTIADFFKEK